MPFLYQFGKMIFLACYQTKESPGLVMTVNKLTKLHLVPLRLFELKQRRVVGHTPAKKCGIVGQQNGFNDVIREDVGVLLV